MTKGVRYFALIPAAGVSVRMRADRPKQYMLIEGEPLLQRVVNIFTAIPLIQKVVIALHPKDHWWPSLALSHPEKTAAVIGGDTRAASVLRGLMHLENNATADDFIVVHDAARPFITDHAIMTLIDALKDHPVGGLLGVPVVDTLKQVDDKDNIVATVSRTNLWQAQTPQCFRYGILQSSMKAALSKNIIVTDEASAIEQAGYFPKMVLGDARNKKITFFEDLFN